MSKYDPKQFGHVALLKGGTSSERDISLASAKHVAAALRAAQVQFTEIDIDEMCIMQLSGKEFDCAFIALHGGAGENGTVQAILEVLHVPYTSPGVKASAIAMDKMRTKWIWEAQGLPTPPACIVRKQNVHEFCAEHGFPVAIKPMQDGSSLGVHKVTCTEELSAAIVDAEQYGEVMCEKWVEGDEFTVSIVGEHVLPMIQIIPDQGELLDFRSKYSPDTQRIAPKNVTDADRKACALLAKQAFDAIAGERIGRVDILRDNATGRFYLIEVNTVPGMSENSLLPVAARMYGWDMPRLCLEILSNTVAV